MTQGFVKDRRGMRGGTALKHLFLASQSHSCLADLYILRFPRLRQSRRWADELCAMTERGELTAVQISRPVSTQACFCPVCSPTGITDVLERTAVADCGDFCVDSFCRQKFLTGTLCSPTSQFISFTTSALVRQSSQAGYRTGSAWDCRREGLLNPRKMCVILHS